MDAEANREAQRKAKDWLRCAAIALLSGLGASVGLLYWVRSADAKGSLLDDDMFLVGVVLLGFVAYLGACVVQWRALVKFALCCWSCQRRLATGVHLFRSPNYLCPHCGQKALLKNP